MSERILRALMQLFAIITKVDDSTGKNSDESIESTEGRAIVETFLKSELNSTLVSQYLDLFDEFLESHNHSNKKKDGERKRTSVNSVKVLRICSQINKELTQIQKVIVLIRILEFINVNVVISDQELDFAETVADSFNIDKDNYELIKDFIESKLEEHIDSSKLMYISAKDLNLEKAKYLTLPKLDSEIRILRLDIVNVLFFRYLGTDVIKLNGQITTGSRIQIFSNGATLKTSKSLHLYYSDVISRFLHDELGDKLTFKIEGLTYVFKNGKTGLHETNFVTESGNLIGIMGGSGTGKSTFLSLLNGNRRPSTGKITLNGIDIHQEKEKIQGAIGFISQDDLLIEELSVYQNLFFNAQLCFKKLTSQDIHEKVMKILSDVGLKEVAPLTVGSPMDKTISGGQRKRLNVALELIREPSVLFVDEPTSGLSSRDSENIMDLLKELALKGKLVFVVIHQPSSEIFKMFDRLFILDQGGFPIFDGNPIDAVVYFKTQVNHVNAEERECHVCGNVNPEQIFNIIESKVVDEFGNLTETRKKRPQEWNTAYLNKVKKTKIEDREGEIETFASKPNKLKQFSVFFKRDILSKLANKQYVAINLLEAPILALVLSFFVKFFDFKGTNMNYVYSLYHNENIPQYIFISVIMALFLGLTVAAEEIIKDRHILKRESFLNLSRSSYLFSKVSIMFSISAIQTFTFVLIGNYILEIPGLLYEHWLVLFSTSCFANVLGLIISSSFNSAKVIYIIVPLLIIPQLLFSGVIVKFDKLHHFFSAQKEVPWIGNIMVTRWSYEAMAVSQYLNSPLENDVFKYKQLKSENSWKRDYWVPEIKHQLEIIRDQTMDDKKVKVAQNILTNEINKEQKVWGNLLCNDCEEEIMKREGFAGIESFLGILQGQYNSSYSDATHKIDSLLGFISQEKQSFYRNAYENENLSDLVTNGNDFDRLVIYKSELIQKADPIYQDTRLSRFMDCQLYSPYKFMFGIKISTLYGNIIFVWITSLLLFIVLYFDGLRRLFQVFPSKKR
jgi:ABC-type multidrug transport system ATPase subunit